MIELEKISFGYRYNHKLLDGLSLTLDPGHIHGLLGANGTGKTTLLKIMAGLLFPQKGSARVDTLKASRRQVQLYRKLFFVPEEFDLPAISFRNYVRVNAPFYPDFSHEQLNEYVREFEIDSEAKLNQLSMGQRKRAQIAFAMACNTPILLLDEPTNGLDIPAKRVFRRLLAGYADEQRTVVISTHQVRDIEEMIDSIVILDPEGIVLNLTTEEITRRIWFGPVGAAGEPIYYEEGISGKTGILKNPNGRDSRLDLELLFNASIRARKELSTLLNR